MSSDLGLEELSDVLATAAGSKAERIAARKAFLKKRTEIWENIRAGRFPTKYISAGNRKVDGARARTAIRCDFLLASKLALGAAYRKDNISDLAERDFLFYVLRDRETFPNRSGKKFYCCRHCTSKLYECVSAGVFRYIDNGKWKAAIEAEP